MITEEIWKDIPGYEGLYQASSLGRIKSCQKVLRYRNGKIVHRNERMMVLTKGFGQYLTVGLSKNDVKKLYNVHYLIAITFIDNPNNLPCLNHKDEDKFNNSVENLEWCSYSYNTKYNNNMRKKIDTRNSNNSRGCEKQVYQYDLQGNFIKKWDSLKSIQRELGYKVSNISSCCLNKTYRHNAYGYKWSYNPQ